MDRIVEWRSALFICVAGFLVALPLKPQNHALAQDFPWFTRTAPRVEPSSILVNIEWVGQRLGTNQLVPVDVRSAQLFALGHLPGAIHLPPAVPPERGGLRRSLPSIDRTLVLYGGTTDRQAIGQAYLSLLNLGFADVRVLLADFNQWTDSGRVTETIVRNRRGGRSPSPFRSLTPSQLVTREELLGVFGRPGFEILDLRDPGGWGPLRQAPPRFSTGHIPNSLPFDPSTLLPERGWPGVEALQGLVANVSIRPADPIDLEATFILYGEDSKDPRLGLGLLVLRMLGLSVRVFPEGFEGWSRHDRDPVVRIVDATDVGSLLSNAKGKKPQGERLVMFDLRETWDFDDGHIPGAVNLPERLFAEQFEGMLRSAGRSDPARVPLVFYCYGRECIRSRKCSTLAAQKGFRYLYWFREGMPAWTDISGPVVKSTAKP